MSPFSDPDATIVAVASAPGRGGVGCVRVSGPDAVVVAGRLFRPESPRSPDRPGSCRFGRFLDRAGDAIDHGYAVRFAPGASFTGESTVELWAHGSPAVLGELVAAAVAHGARPASPGEFTYRAMRHGRIDLARAEAVRDLVDARTTYQAKVAFAQSDGALSRRLRPLRDALQEMIARGEAAVEFVDESETELSSAALAGGIDDVRDRCRALTRGFRTGRLVREGARLVMIGLPNAGKSSLFNQLLVRERAIVTEVPGTTRDTLEESLDLGGIPVTLVDTAGLRKVSDAVESEGVRRAEQARDEADVVVLVIDGARDVEPLEREELDALDARDADGVDGRTVVVVNKNDLPEAASRGLPRPDALRVSARTGEGCDRLRTRLREHLLGPAGHFEDPVITNVRHADAMERCADALDHAAAAVEAGWSEEVVLEDLRDAMNRLGTITGEFSTEDLYDRIFSTFCIGK